MPDAGVMHKDHYRTKMTAHRFQMRSLLLKTIRAETDLLADFQQRVRTPLLDQYFALTANLGTHLFYMVFLPLIFWMGNPKLGYDFVWGLGIGVAFTGVVKDWLCLPRPLSPPVHRISMSGSAVLEYGFPSTHSCNALTIALVLLEHFGLGYLLPIAFLVVTIVAGRLYSGMHGFLDVGLGSALGVLVYIFRISVRDFVDHSFAAAFLTSSVAAFFFMTTFITVHPQPVDDCPCFDDTVAFLSVLFGVEVFAGSYYQYMGGATNAPPNALFLMLRFVLGVAVIVVWRIVAKKTMLTILPPILRRLQKIGLVLPRKYYTLASQYDTPKDVPGETVIDSPKQFRETMSNIRKTRGRSDSVGMQSEHDFYEAMENPRAKLNRQNSGYQPPRKRYDVEVTTKVVVYAGIPLCVFWIVMPLFSYLHI